jgi:hypothetical protein
MFCWPNARDNESKIIEQFNFVQDHLNIESAVEFCQKSPNFGFLYELYDARHIHYEGAFQSYLTCLRTIVPLVSRSDFLRIVPRSCPGCVTLQLLCILCLHPILENEVNNLFRELLCDPRGDILHQNDIRQMAMMIRQVYKRREYPFPYMGDCLGFERESQGYNMAQVIGQLISSTEFCDLMDSNSTIGAQIAHEMMKNLQDSQQQSNQLKVLLSKYQKLTSESKLDT